MTLPLGYDPKAGGRHAARGLMRIAARGIDVEGISHVVNFDLLADEWLMSRFIARRLSHLWATFGHGADLVSFISVFETSRAVSKNSGAMGCPFRLPQNRDESLS